MQQTRQTCVLGGKPGFQLPLVWPHTDMIINLLISDHGITNSFKYSPNTTFSLKSGRGKDELGI